MKVVKTNEDLNAKQMTEYYQATIEKQGALIDFLAMAQGIELETEEEGRNESELSED